MKKLIILITIFFIVAGLSYSDEDGKFIFKIGILAKHKESLYVGVDSKLILFPYLQIKYKRVNFDGDRINLELFQKSGFNFRLVSKINYDGYKGEDSDYLQGMEDRKGVGYLEEEK